MTPIEETELRLLIKKRGAIKAKVTRFQAFVNNVDNDNDLTQLTARIEKIKPIWEEFEQIQTRIEELSQDLTAQATEREEFENAYFVATSSAEEHVKRMQPAQATITSSNNSQNGNHESLTQVKLPTINLPTFSGAYDQWHSFYDTFTSLIHDNPNISEIQKFHYLRSALIDEAAQVIYSLDISILNYSVAWDILKERYENTRLIVQNHVKSLFDLPIMTKESPGCLRQLMDTVARHLRALKSLNQPTESWDVLIIHLVTSKFDAITRREWESVNNVKELPSMVDLNKFLQNRCHILQSLEVPNQTSKVKQSPPQAFKQRTNTRSGQTQSYTATNKALCPKCSQNHHLYHCEEFVKLSVNDRFKDARKLNLCLNCLRSTHKTQQCNSGSCRICAKKHNTLLHLISSEEKKVQDSSGTTAHHATQSSGTNPDTSSERRGNQSTDCMQAHHATQEFQTYQVALSTAVVNIYDSRGRPHQCRALLDSGSQSNFITEHLAKRLELTLHSVSLPVLGVNHVVTNVQHTVQAKVRSRFNSFQADLGFLVLPQITERLPTVNLNRSQMSIPQHLRLADPDFDTPAFIDILLGAEIFWDLLCVGQIKQSKTMPILQNTHFGWVISGRCLNPHTSNTHVLHCQILPDDPLQQQLTNFWNIEEIAALKRLSPEEQECEEHFSKHTQRSADGRFIVKLPLRSEAHELGESRSIALNRFRQTEKRLDKNPEFKEQYNQNLEDYIQNNHMELVPESEIQTTSRTVNYLPHHAVVKEHSITTKVRVVFDGSAATTNGVSLNDLLMVGPAIQEDLFTIILRFRIHKHVITADIKKMYRQIWIHPDQTDLQRILWRSQTDVGRDSLPVQTYRLKTVTFGTATAPFLATRCLAQLAYDASEIYPVSSAIILRDFYMDDLLSGSESVAELETIKREVSDILKQGGFQLHKWNSDIPEIRDQFQIMDKYHLSSNLQNRDPVKTLGLWWDSKNDCLGFQINLNKQARKGTKRLILGIVAGIFDPLGLIGPVTVTAKILIQELWQLCLDWDTAIPIHLFTKWQVFHQDLRHLNLLKVPRRVISVSQRHEVQIHGFCDASQSAYGACIFVRTSSPAAEISSRLLCAKSRVAPLKTISVPRLELCATLLLAKLMKKVIPALGCEIHSATYWTDSTVALAWIRSSPHKWKTFVANRVSEIQELSDPGSWKHVRTHDNPADLLSRGLPAHQISDCRLWWNGPLWLTLNEECWPVSLTSEKQIHECPEARKAHVALITTTEENIFFTKFSTFTKLVTVATYCLRFKANCQSPHDRQLGPLTTQERVQAVTRLIRVAQKECFNRDLNQLSKKLQVHPKSNLLSLAPFLDDQHLIRVGGRLQLANITHSQKHPIILPRDHPLTRLIVMHEHLKQLHGGAQATLAAIRRQYWIIAGYQFVKGVIHRCLRCFRVKPRQEYPEMGQLPSSRVIPSRPFSRCGVDFCGPFMLRDGGRRSKRRIKAYGAIFVCFATRAVHIELVSDLTTEAFLGTLRRFIGRRGKPQEIHSDNATNFTGTNRELLQLNKQFSAQQHQDQIAKSLAEDGITWKFIPANSPHFGGLWEAAVKATKHHLRRIVGDASLSYEELYTVLVQIEACLNSRPITPLTADPNDLAALTPGHFLIGSALTSLNEPSLESIKLNRLSRWQRTVQLTQHFWTRWSREYLVQLQQRNKWNKSSSPVQIGSMVVLREDKIPPLRWLLGRIVQLFPGSDGVVRVASIRTSSGLVKRALTKMCILPLEKCP